jgi:hypothetical protein
MQSIEILYMDSYHCSSLHLLPPFIYFQSISFVWCSRLWWYFATCCTLISPIVEMIGTNHTLNVVSFGQVYILDGI